MDSAVAPQPETAVAPVKKKATWKDFPLKEHVRGYLAPVPQHYPIKISEIDKEGGHSVCRVDVFDAATETFPISIVLKIIETPDGYVFQERDEKTEEWFNRNDEPGRVVPRKTDSK
jgi:hypothetical protein